MQPQVDLRSSAPPVLDINAVARATGIAASKLRFYEEKRLIRSIGRRGLRRLFPANVLERLALISLGQAAGFSLDEIAHTLTLEGNPDGRPRIDRRLLAARADTLEVTIVRLRKLRDGLRHAAACPAPSHLECPTFQRLLRTAALGVRRKRRPNDPGQFRLRAGEASKRARPRMRRRLDASSRRALRSLV